MQSNTPAETSLPGVPPEDRITIDPVTGLRNEYLFHLRLRDEFFRAREREGNAALLAIKLDDIIGINGRHGRQGGDEALRSIANLLRSLQGTSEHADHLLFKLSGPVFGYFMPASPAEEALSLAQTIVGQVFLSDLFLERLSVSIGLVNLYEFFTSAEDIEKIVQAVERAAFKRLAIAEARGGNTVCAESDVEEAFASPRPLILIVDPDPTALELLVIALKAADMDVATCLNGETAFTLIQSKPPAAIICEALTPRLNGFMLRDRLRVNAYLGAIPFLLVSHKKTEEFIRKAADLDIRHFFRKPVSVAEITGLLSNMLRGNSSHGRT